MIKAKVSILIAQFAYGGNGGTASIIPELAWWLARNFEKMRSDERIDRAKVGYVIHADTPITMTRNRAVAQAIAGGFDMLLMLDSDNEPDGYLGHDPRAVPFWETAFDFAYQRLLQNKPSIIMAPYCGPPPHPVRRPGVEDLGEVPYLFQWMNDESDVPRPGYKLTMLTRNEAAQMHGLHPIAAGPTGVSLWTTNVFEPMKRPIFDYHFSPDGAEKQTTEDVHATRNASLVWQDKIGENVLFATLDSWALHHKPKRVGRPVLTTVEHIAADFREAVEAKRSVFDEFREVSFDTSPSYDGPAQAADDDNGETADEVYEPVAEDAGDPFDDDEPEPESPINAKVEKQNGHPPGITHKRIGGRKVAIIGDGEIPDDDLENIERCAAYLVQQRGRTAIEAAVVHCGTGQVAAAINAVLPPASHLYLFDTLATELGGDLMAEQLKQTFRTLIATNRVATFVEERVLPKLDAEEFDLVVLERYVTLSLLKQWMPTVGPGGLLIGLGMNEEPVAEALHAFADATGRKLRTISGTNVWAITNEQPAAQPAAEESDEAE